MRCPAKRVRNSSGLTLIEVLVAAVLIMLLATEVAAFFTRGRMSVVEEARKRTALGLATQELERLEMLPPGAMLDVADQIEVASWTYSRTTHIEADQPVAGMVQATTEVTWQTRAGKSRKITLEAAYGNPR